MMDKVWLRNYPEGVPAEADVDAYDSIVSLFEESVRRFGDRPAYSSFGVTITLPRPRRALAGASPPTSRGSVSTRATGSRS